MTRFLLALILVTASAPAHAWEAGSEGRICTLTHTEAAGDVRLTYDPLGPLYSITVTKTAPWPDAPVFGIAFEGGAAQTITTGRHVLSQEGRALTVTDRGFGNVLDGLALNRTATMVSGAATVAFSLDGAANEVEAFRACEIAPTA